VPNRTVRDPGSETLYEAAPVATSLEHKSDWNRCGSPRPRLQLRASPRQALRRWRRATSAPEASESSKGEFAAKVAGLNHVGLTLTRSGPGDTVGGAARTDSMKKVTGTGGGDTQAGAAACCLHS
jgi:hypothetical protein